MDTKKWGPSGWVFLHAIAENYDPAIHDTQSFKRFFTDVGGVLPCIHCRNSYQEFSQELPIDDYLKTPGGLAEWIYLIHNKVNKKLRDQGLPVGSDPSLESVNKKYQNFKVENCHKSKTCRTGQSGQLGAGQIAKKCRAKTESGDRCRRNALTGKKFCYQH